VLDFAVHDVDFSLVLTFLAKAKPPIAVVFRPEAFPAAALWDRLPEGRRRKDLSFCLIDSHVVRAEEARKGITRLRP
jgi:hypothetical protein